MIKPSGASQLIIRMKKGRDGPHSLACSRPDGSVTIQHNRHAFFPPHDLTHYAVESVLGYTRGFYGLVADGWDLADFGTPWPRGLLPKDLDPAEVIAGRLDLERASGERLNVAELNAFVADWYCQQRPEEPVSRPVTTDELARIHRLRGELHARWHALEPGEVIELRFPPDPE
ncbi:MAG: hypothetical protein ACREL7_16650 [Longimicrobiales bacterium]